jgi:hypothetical protein
MITAMPNLYFCQPHAKNQGMLRAVLSLPELESMVREHSLTYVGAEFPAFGEGQDGEHDFALLGFRSEETTAAWRPGFYRIESDLNAVNEALLKLAR